MIIGRDIVDYNNYYEPEERLYSTGYDDLDEAMERAFSEGYEYAQREFAKKAEEESRLTKAQKAAIIAGASTLGTAGAIQGAHAIGRKIKDSRGLGRKTWDGITGVFGAKGSTKKRIGNALMMPGEKLKQAGKWISKKAKKIIKR